MSDYRNAPPEIITAIEHAARTVAQTLSDRGVHTLGVSDRGVAPGVEIDLDTGDHLGQGVYLSWYPGSKVVSDAVNAMKAGRLDDPSIQLQGEIRETQINTIMVMLQEVGVEVEEVDDDYRPFTIRVPYRQFS